MKLTEKEKNDLVRQYEPLINKIVAQFYNTVKCSQADLKSMANEGFAAAIYKYNGKKSSQSFTQFAAYQIRFSILTHLDNELRTVKLSYQAQKRMVEEGKPLFNTVSIDQPYAGSDDDESTPREIVMNMYENEKFSNGDVLKYLCDRLKRRFSEQDCDIFFSTFGLDGHDIVKGTKLAKKYKITQGRISQKRNAMINYIRKDKDLCEMLATLQEGVR